MEKNRTGMNNTGSVKANAVLNMTRTLMGLAFPLVTFPYASRILLPEGIGRVNFALSVTSYFAIVASLGIENYGIREAAKVRDDRQRLSRLVREVFAVNMVSTAAAYALLAAALLGIPRLAEYRGLLCVCSAGILFSTIGVNWLYSALEDYLYITVRSVAFQVLSAVMLFAFVRTKDDCVQYAAIAVVSSAGSNILNLIHSRKFVDFWGQGRLSLKRHVKPIMVLFAMAVTVKLYTALDTTMLGFMKGDREVGIYTAATKINKMVLSLVTAASAVLLPRLSFCSGQEDKSEFLRLSYKGFDAVLLIAIPCAVGLCVLSAPVVHILSGAEYDAAIVPMRIMNPVILIIGLSGYVGIQLFMPLGRERWTLWSVVAGAAVNLTLNMFLIPRYGASGASVATVTAESCVTAVQLCLARRYLALRPVLLSFLKYLACSCVMSAAVFLCMRLAGTELLALAVGVPVGIVVYSTLLVAWKDAFAVGFLGAIRTRLRERKKEVS